MHFENPTAIQIPVLIETVTGSARYSPSPAKNMSSSSAVQI